MTGQQNDERVPLAAGSGGAADGGAREPRGC